MKTKLPASQFHMLYHELRPSATAYSYVTSADSFQRHIDLYAGLLAGGSPLVPVITFDDGHVSNLEIAAPALEAHNLTAHFFITVGWVSTRHGYMDWTQIRTLQQAGHAIGAHGWSHAFLTHCSPTQLDIELTRARLALEDRLGVSITTMSLPGGRANRRVLLACRAAGYTRVFTSIPRIEPVPLGFTIGRLNIRGDIQPDWLTRLFEPSSPLLSRLIRVHRFKTAAQSVLGDCLYARLWAIVNREELSADPEFSSDSALPTSRQEPHA